jgi:dGTPase
MPVARYRERGIPAVMLEDQKLLGLDLSTHASAEAQAASVSDDIAYDTHDVDDGLRAGLFGLADIRMVPFLADILSEIAARHPALDRSRTIHELSRRIITRLVEDVIATGRATFESGCFTSSDEVRRAGRPLVAFSATLAEADGQMKDFLFAHMYRHPRVLRVRERAAEVVRDLFGRFFCDPSALPGEWSRNLAGADEHKRARRVADYIAGMTDRFALDEHRRLFDTTPELR